MHDYALFHQPGQIYCTTTASQQGSVAAVFFSKVCLFCACINPPGLTPSPAGMTTRNMHGAHLLSAAGPLGSIRGNERCSSRQGCGYPCQVDTCI